MRNKVVFVAFISLFIWSFVEGKNVSNVTKFVYPTLYRQHVFYDLSPKGKAMFYAINIHPLCAAKGGECMPRAKCIEKQMLYISRTCYTRDLVCCYDNRIHRPSIGRSTDNNTQIHNDTTSNV